jgi:putative ABC transport system permease protein
MTAVAARHALVRWAWRMFRREWRQQILVLALLTVAVATAVCSITVAYNTGPADDARFGSASTLLRFEGSDPRRLAAALAAAEKWFGTTDVIAHRYANVPGGTERVYYRALDPNGAHIKEALAVLRGSYPTRPDEVAVTDGVAAVMRLELGSTLTLDGQSRTVVGIVENRHALSDDFALVAPATLRAPQYVTVLVDASGEAVNSFTRSQDERGRAALVQVESRPEAQAADALAMFAVATVFLLLAGLVAAAGFAVVAQRRLRQLGMLAAVGATQKQLRIVLLANGALAGVIAALGGAIAGFAIWVAVAPIVESATDHRIDLLSVPWGLVALALLLAVLAATAAAWWPGRAAARLPVVLALSGRPPKPRSAGGAAAAAVALIAVGVGSLALSNRGTEFLIVSGIVATILGTLLLGPPAIRIFAGLAGRASIAPRLALRDLVRYQARSGAALAAVTLALGVAAAAVVVASAEAAKRNAEPPNLSDRQIRVHLGPHEDREATPVDALARRQLLDAGVRRLAAELDDATVVPLRKAMQPGAPPNVVDDTPVVATVDLTRRKGRHPRISYLVEGWLFVATPPVLRYLGIDPSTVDPGADFLAYRGVPTDELVIPDLTNWRAFPVTNVQRIETRRRLFGSFDFGFNEVKTYVPPTFLTLEGLRRRGWKQVPSTWLVESRRPLTSDQLAAARRVAADSGFTIEVRRERTSFARPMAIALGAGALLALGILALTVGLIRSESARDLRTLTATGATSRIRRTLTATTAGALALLGALLGVTGAYLALTAIYHDDLAYLSDVPVVYLALGVVGVPVAASTAGWLLAGREPPAIARTAIE